MVVTLQSSIRDQDHMFDRALLVGDLDSVHHQAEDPLLGGEAEIRGSVKVLGADQISVHTDLSGKRAEGYIL